MPRRKKKTKTERFVETARRQFKRSCIPTTTAVCLSVGISKLGVPALPLILVGGAGVAWWKGYRIRIVREDGDANRKDVILADKQDSESSQEGEQD